MPLPELGLSLSLTDNEGSPFYAGHKAREKMGDFDSAIKQHTIIITISDEKINEVKLNLRSDFLETITLPTYKMMVTDDKTEEKTFYEVTRDSFLLDELKSESVGGFSFFGVNIFKKKIYSLPFVTFEPLVESIELFEVSKYRTKKEDYMSYTLHRDGEKAVMISGKAPNDFLKHLELNKFFYVVDHNEGRKFIGDISYREKFIKSVPRVEIHLIKRTENIKKYELDKKGRVNKIIYL